MQIVGEQQVVLSTPVESLNLGVRVRRVVNELNIQTVGDLVKLEPAELLARKNFGRTSLDQLQSVLSELGLRLRNT